jgi:hypothetical protein
VRKGERDREKEKGGREITIEHEPTIYYIHWPSMPHWEYMFTSRDRFPDDIDYTDA